jgi:hypothetical protein
MPVRTARRTKKSYTLSPDSVTFLENARKKRRAQSVSAVLEEILQAVRNEEERASVERGVTDYYSSLSAAELEEQKLWGEVALDEMSKQEPR